MESFLCSTHWVMRGEAPSALVIHPPPMGPISFIFKYVFTEKHPHWRLAPPNRSALPQREILDPPLVLQTHSVMVRKGSLLILPGLRGNNYPLICSSDLDLEYKFFF